MEKKAFKAKLNEALEKKAKRKKAVIQEPRYDDVFYEGLSAIEGQEVTIFDICGLAKESERTRCLKAVDDEPEWSENAPEHYGVLEKMFKANLIKETKQNIRKRIEEGL